MRKRRIAVFLTTMLSALTIAGGSIALPVHAEEGGADGDWGYEDDWEYDDWDDMYVTDEEDDDHGENVYVENEDVYGYIGISLGASTAHVGDKVSAHADVFTNLCGGNMEIRWESGSSTIATINGYGDDAMITARGEGVTTIRASLYINGRLTDTDTMQLKVKAKKPDYISVTGLNLGDTSATINVGGSYKIYARVEPSNANNQGLSWSSSNPDICYVDSDGTIHGKNSGSCTITVRTNENGHVGNCYVTVNGRTSTTHVDNVWVNPTAVTLAINQYMYITPTVTPTDAADKSLTWTSSNPAVATVSSGGKVNGVSAGTAVITVRTNDGGKTATTVVTVGSAVAAPGASAVTGTIEANNTRSSQLCFDTTNKILTAAPGATVLVNATSAMSYDVNVATAMKMRPDVAVMAAFGYQGHVYTLTLPANYNLAAHLDKTGYAEWLNLAALKDGPVLTLIQ